MNPRPCWKAITCFHQKLVELAAKKKKKIKSIEDTNNTINKA